MDCHPVPFPDRPYLTSPNTIRRLLQRVRGYLIQEVYLERFATTLRVRFMDHRLLGSWWLIRNRRPFTTFSSWEWQMSFTIDYTVSKAAGSLVYRRTEFSFDTVGRKCNGLSSILLNDLQLEVDESKRICAVLGLCPHTTWEEANVLPPNPKQGALVYGKDLIPGVSVRAGGFSVGLNSEGQITGFNFNSVLYGENPTLSPALQQQIRQALAPVTAK